MRTSLAIAILLFLAGLPLRADTAMPEAEKGFSLVEEGTKLILRGMLNRMEPALREAQDGLGTAMNEWGPAMRDLAVRLGDLSAYELPQVLPNGDVIIRRKRPSPDVPGPDGQTEL